METIAGARDGGDPTPGASQEALHRRVARSEAYLRAVIDSALDAIISSDGDSRITGWNAHAETLFGWSAEEVMGRRLDELIIPPQHRQAHREGVEHYLATGQGPILNQRLEITALHRDGGEFPVELTVAVASFEGETHFSAFIRDRRGELAAEARLNAEHAAARVLADASDPAEALPAVLGALGEALGWDAGAFWEVRGEQLVCAAFWGAERTPALHQAASVPGAGFSRGEGLPGRVWQSGMPEWIHDAGRARDFTRTAAAETDGIRSAFAFPVQAAQQVLGVAEFFTRARLLPDNALLAMARSIGSDLGQVLRRLELEAERERTVQDIRRVNDLLARGNAELAARTAEAERARSAADEANRAKSEFLAVMSHELRTPINAILGYTDLLELEVAGTLTAEQRSYTQRLRESGRHLLGLINEVLDLAKIEAGRMGVQRDANPLSEAAGTALPMLAAQARAKHIELVNDCAGCDAAYLGDAGRVRQIVVNLLSNAVKFTPEGGRVRVSCGVTGKVPRAAHLAGDGPWACIQVEDNGIGIAPEDAEAVFQPFVQADQGPTRSSGGTGLGLTISRRLARLMGGDLTLASSPGKGSCFTLWLPTRDVTSGEAPPPPEKLAPPDAADQQALRAAGKALLRELDPVVARFVAALREARLVPGMAEMPEAEAVDHQSTLLTDIALTLHTLGEVPGLVDELRDGTDLQRLLSLRHGEQRARLGFSEAALRREFELLGEALRVAIFPPGATPVPAVEAVVRRLLLRAEQNSMQGLRMAEG